MWLVEPPIDVLSVTKSSNMWLAKPASLQSANKQRNPRRHQYVYDDNNCQSTELNKKISVIWQELSRYQVYVASEAKNRYAFTQTGSTIPEIV